MAGTKKSTRKFQAKHLGRAIQQRRVLQNKKRKRGQDGGKHEHHATRAHDGDGRERQQSNGVEDDDDEGDEQRPPTAARPADDGKEADEDDDEDGLDVDDFLSSGLLGDEEGDDEAAAAAEDDEDDEAEETSEEAEARLLAEIEEHEAEMKALAKSDPAFYKHLQDNDAELLQFNKADILSQPTNEDDDEEEDEEDEQHAVDGAAGKKKTKAVKSRKAKTGMSLQQWRVLKRQVNTVHSISGLRKALRLFRAASHANDEEKTGEDDTTAQLRFSSSKLFSDVIQFSVTQLPAVFAHHLSPTAGSSNRSLSSHPKFKTVGPLLKTYLAAYIHLLATQHDSKMTRLLLHTCLTTLVPLFEAFPKLILRLFKHLITLWSTADRSTRIDAFLCIRELCVQHGGRQGVLEEAMRAMYLTYVSYARFTSGNNVGVLEFMANCIVELFGLDGPLAYQHAFVYIRQLAIHLRNATQGGKATGGGKKAGAAGEKGEKRKGKKAGVDELSYKAVYNWQFINSLRVWTKVLASPLAAQPAASTSAATVPSTPATLRPLLYPFVQVCLGVLTLLPSSRYHPLRLVVINFLITLSTACHLYIPLVPSILSLFSSPELTRKPTSTSAKSPDIRFLLKVSKSTSLTRGYQEQVTSAALRSLVHFYALHSYSLAYPEVMLVATRYLRRWVKQSKIGRLKKEINAVVTQLEWNGDWVKERREKLDYTPKDCVDGKVDAMYGVRGSGGGVGRDGKEEVSPLERYVKMGKVEEDGEGGAVDWEGKERQGRRGTGDEEEDERDDEEVEGDEDDEEEDGDVEYDDDDDMDVDGEDVDGEEDEDEDDEAETKRKPGNKKQKATTGSSKQASSNAATAKKASRSTESGQTVKAAEPQKGKRSQVWASADTAEDEDDTVTPFVLSDDDD